MRDDLKGTMGERNISYEQRRIGEGEGIRRSGYCTLDRYRWICQACFQDFQEQFEWRLANDQTSAMPDCP